MSSTAYSVFTKFMAVDKVSGVFKNMGDAARVFGNKSERSFSQASKSASHFGTITKSILAAGVINRATAAIEQGLAGATVQFVEFDHAITSASAKFKGLNLATKEGQDTLNRLKNTAREVGAATQFSATQAAQGLDFLALAGFNADQAMAALPGTVDLATVANVDLAQATDIATDSLGAFNLMSSDSAKLQKNLARVNDVFAKTQATANTNLVDLFEAVKKGGPEFVQAGQSIETFSAMAGYMANAGVKGEEAGTQLRNMIMRLSAPTAAASKVLKQLGVRVSDANGNTRDAIDIFADLQKGLAKIPGDTKRSAAATEIFGARSAGLKVLLGSNIEELRKYRSELEAASGASKQMSDIMRQSLLNRLKSLQSALIELTFKVFTNFEKRGGKAIDSLTEAVRNFDPQPIIDGIEKTISLFKTTIDVVKSLSDYILIAAGSFAAYHLVIKGIIITQKAMALWGFISAFVSLAAQVRTVTGAMALFNLVMNANPIGLVIAAIGLLVAAGVLLYKNWDTVSSFMMKTWDTLKDLISGGISFLIDFYAFFIKSIVSGAKLISGAFGFDTSAFDNALNKIAELQKKSKDAVNSSGYVGAEPLGPVVPNKRQSPNEVEAEARMKALTFEGVLNIAGAPQGSTFENKGKGAPPLRVNMMGAQ